jgi:cation diffusion facilitator CzcD-associated flavoprotein CzcO
MKTAKSIEGSLNGIMGIKAMMTSSAESQTVRKFFQNRMRERLTDDEIFHQLLPDFSVGCRRLTPGDPFMKAVQQPNMRLHKAAVESVRGRTVIGDNGDEVEVDTLICATGFDVSYVPKYTMTGRGTTLQKKWAKDP